MEKLRIAYDFPLRYGCYTVSLYQWLESEKLRLGHLRDRASEKGRRKEYPLILHFLIVTVILNPASFCL